MFQFLFKYPRAVFAKGQIVLLGSWPTWVLWLSIAGAALALAAFMRLRLSTADPRLRTWRTSVLWLLQSAMAAVLLTLMWQPVVLISELKPQQDIIAVLVDDSRSMTIADGGVSRITQAVNALQGGTLA